MTFSRKSKNGYKIFSKNTVLNNYFIEPNYQGVFIIVIFYQRKMKTRTGFAYFVR
jgi:hypothetical protein